MDVNLVMFTPKGKRKDFPLTKSTTIIGRGEKCDLRVPVLSVSRRHCELALSDDTLNIRDLGSSNGTYVNNERISEAELEAGDRLVVGPVVFTIQINGEPEEIEPTPVGEGEEIVDLETAEAGSEKTGITESDIVSALQPEDEDEEEEDQAISALEALASEAEEKEGDSEEQDQNKGG